MKTVLNCRHADTCLSDYWSGHHLAHIQIAVYPNMTVGDVRKALHNELSQGFVAGSDDRTLDNSGDAGDKWFKAAHAAINRDVKQTGPGRKYPFSDIECGEENDVYAFFVFTDVEG